ncbi:MAG: xylose isomerase [Acidobacteria bacterium]|nr:MAG: xylose isomerase [Acidobacteriota bacterium]
MSALTRRQFVQSSVMLAMSSPFSFASSSSAERLPIGFSTLGCPAWDWLKILDFAQQNGFAAVELRGLQGTMDLPARPEFAPGRIEESKKEVSAHGLRISCLGSSAHLHESDPAKHEQQLAEARRFIDLASALDAPYVRVFGNNIVGGREQVIEHVAKALRQLGDYAGQKNVTVIIESHGDFIDSPTLHTILDSAHSSHVGLLWDAHHTFVSGKEDPAFTVSQLGKYIRHTHLKDSVPQGNDVRYVLTGRGTVPVRRQVEELTKIGYSGYYSFEWEKVWHPDIEEPEIAIADYARVVTQYIKDARSTSTRTS